MRILIDTHYPEDGFKYTGVVRTTVTAPARGLIRPVEEWCKEHISALPEVETVWDNSQDSRSYMINFYGTFASGEDALAFSLKWL